MGIFPVIRSIVVAPAALQRFVRRPDIFLPDTAKRLRWVRCT